MERPWTDEDCLRELYWEQEMSQPEIARELNCSKQTIERWFRKFDIETRSQENAQKLNQKSGHDYCNKEEHQWQNEDVLYEMYVEKSMGAPKIANELETRTDTIYRWLEKHGIETRDKKHPETGGISPRSASGDDISGGYVRFRDSDSSVFIHQLLAVAAGEDPHKVFSEGEHHIHHKNDIPWDNRPENIELVSRKSHVAHHSTYD